MIARPLPAEEFDSPRVRSGTRAGRSAVGRRYARARRLRYAALLRLLVAVAFVTLLFFAYLALMANVTRMNYDLARVSGEKAALIDVSVQLDDRIASLESRDHLAKLAAQLGMHEPQTFAEISAPAQQTQARPDGIAFLDWLK